MGGANYTNEQPRLADIRLQQSAYGSTIPWLLVGRGRVAGNLVYYGAFKAIKHSQTQRGGKGGGGSQTTVSYTYQAAVIIGLARGPLVGGGAMWRGKSQFGSFAAGGLSLATGALAQPVWSWLSSNDPTRALGYSGLAYAYAQAYELDDSASLPNHNFEIDAGGLGSVPGVGTVVDGDPRLAVERLLTDERSGAGWPGSRLLGLDRYQAYCRAAGLWLSPVLDKQRTAIEWLQQLLMLTNTRVAYTGSELELVPLGDSDISANGATFTAEITPDFDLTLDHFVPDDGEPPVRVRRHVGLGAERETASSDDVGYNVITLEIENRASGYAKQPISRDDLASIEMFGRRPKDTIAAPEVKDPAIGGQIAQQLLQDELTKRNRYEFNLHWRFCLLRPLRLVTLTVPSLRFDRLPVRVLEVEELDDRRVAVVAEDAPIGVATAPRYGTQAGAGYAPDYNASPGDALPPVIFELPGALSTTGLELGIATGSANPLWGGCQVWVSFDGSNYRLLTELRDASRFGTLQIDSGSGISLFTSASQQLNSGTAADAANLATLIYIVPAGTVAGEYLAYETATLTGASAYTITGLVRRAYGTPQGAHSTGTPWVRVDDAIARSGALDPALIGTTVYVKLTSFNVFGAGQQSLADVSATSYVISGRHYVPDGAGGAGSTMNADPGLLDAAKAWTWDGGITVQGPSTAPGALGVKYFSANAFGPGNLFAFSRQTFPISSARTYNYSALLGAAPGNNRNMYLVVDMFTADGTRLTNADTGWGGSFAGYTFGGVPTSDGAWRRYGGDFGAGTSKPIPASAAYFRVGVWFQYNGGGSSSVQQAAEDIRLVDVTEARAAQSTADVAASNASSALTTLATMRSNGYIDASEKPALIKAWQAIADENAGISAQGTAYGLISLRDAYNGAYYALAGYLTSLSPSWADTTTDTPITPAVDQAKWAAYYSSRQALLDAVAQAANQRINKAQGTNLFAGALASPFGNAAGGNISAVGQPDPLGTANAVNVTLPASGAYVYYHLTGLQAGYYTIKLRLLVGGGSSIVVACTDATTWSGSNYTRATQAGGSIWVQVTLRQYTATGSLDVVVGSQYDATGFTVVQDSSPLPVTVSISDLWVEREGYTGDLAATQNQVFYQDSDPGAVPEGSIWVSSTRSYQRKGGAWRPYVGAGSVDTNELAAGAATTLAEVLLASTDVTGVSLATNRTSYAASYNLLGSITFTPKTTGVANLYISGNLLVDETFTRSSAGLAYAYVAINVDQNDNGVAEAGDELAYVQIQQYVTSGRKMTWSGPIAGRVQVAVTAGVSRTLRVYGQQEGDAPRTTSITNLRLGVEGINR